MSKAMEGFVCKKCIGSYMIVWPDNKGTKVERIWEEMCPRSELRMGPVGGALTPGLWTLDAPVHLDDTQPPPDRVICKAEGRKALVPKR